MFFFYKMLYAKNVSSIYFSVLMDIKNKCEFMRKFQIPGIVADVDGTHIAIHGPPILDHLYPGNLYIKRKGYHS